MDYYGYNDWRSYTDRASYLAHHGILGMKWGIRRFQPYSIGYQRKGGERGKAVGEASGSGRSSSKQTGFRKRMGIRARGFVKRHKAILADTKRQKGVIKKASALLGHRRMETSAKVRSETQKKLADASRTRLFKHVHNTRSINQTYNAGYHKKKYNQTLGRRAFEAVVPITKMKTKYRRLSGRTTNRGRMFIDRQLTGGWAGVALDANHLYKQHKKKKAAKTKR